MARAAKTKKKPIIPPIHADRLARARAAMAKKNLPAYLVTSRKDGFYLTGFTGEDSAVLLTPRRVFLITDSRFDESSEAECPWAAKVLRKRMIEEAMAKLFKRLHLERVGVQPEEMTLEQFADLKKQSRPARLVKAPPIVRRLRVGKDAGELAVMDQAITIAQQAFKATRRSIRVGQTERDLAARLECEMQKRGAVGAAFPTIVAEGPNASLPHAVPGSRKIKKGSAILFDWGARYGFYCSDLTRMVFVGSIPPGIRKIYDVVLEAKNKATAAIRPGARMCDVDAVARGHIKRCGYGKHFGHGLGHGLGLAVHEAPSLSWRSHEKLQPDMVVTVEPGIYLPGIGGVRIEDDVLVTPDGHRVLSSLSTDIADAVI